MRTCVRYFLHIDDKCEALSRCVSRLHAAWSLWRVAELHPGRTSITSALEHILAEAQSDLKCSRSITAATQSQASEVSGLFGANSLSRPAGPPGATLVLGLPVSAEYNDTDFWGVAPFAWDASCVPAD